MEGTSPIEFDDIATEHATKVDHVPAKRWVTECSYFKDISSVFYLSNIFYLFELRSSGKTTM